MRKITKITSRNPKVPRRKRVAAYARVSLDTEELQHSLSAQISYYNQKIQMNPEWDFAGIYADEGISGTGTSKRTDFRRMIADCEDGKIDLILTKSISRFARNTVDLLRTVRRLKDIDVEVWFERENIRSLSGDGELMLSILASFAQEESRSISDNVKWSIKKRYEKGNPNSRFLIFGYRWVGDDLVIVPKEAEIVRRIYREYLSGKTFEKISDEFNDEGLKTKRGYEWSPFSIGVILSNDIYTGDLLLQKMYCTDPISKKMKKNDGELPQYLVEGHHEPIIDKETFELVQQQKKENRERFQDMLNSESCFSGKLKCSHCGSIFFRSSYTKLDGDKTFYWRCGSNFYKTRNCSAKPTVHEEEIKKICCKALGLDNFDENIFLQKVDFISVPDNHEVEIHMKDGSVFSDIYVLTGKYDCWTEERKKHFSEYKLSHGSHRRGTSALTCKIKCAACGCNYHAEKSRQGYRFWRCPTKNCGLSLREDVLQSMISAVLNLDSYDENAVTDRIEKIMVDGENLIFHLNDGSQITRTWIKPAPVKHVYTEEEKAEISRKKSEAMTPERRKRHSERIKELWNDNGIERFNKKPVKSAAAQGLDRQEGCSDRDQADPTANSHTADAKLHYIS